MGIIPIKKTEKHISVSIELVEKYLDEEKDKNGFCFETFHMNYEDVRMTLSQMKNEGKKYLPIRGAGCANINSDGSCGC